MPKVYEAQSGSVSRKEIMWQRLDCKREVNLEQKHFKPNHDLLK